MDKRFKDTMFFVEANAFEQLSIFIDFKDKVKWKSHLRGTSFIVGYIDDHPRRPVNVSFLWINIDGHLVCFYDAVSRFVDHNMVSNWITKHKDEDGHCIPQCNAMNFHLCYNYLKVLGENDAP